MNKHTLLRTLSTIILLTALLATPALAQEEGGGFTETFDTTTPEGWELSPDAVVVDGKLRLSQGSFAVRHGQWSNLTLSVKVQATGEGVIFIHYHFNGPDRYTLLLFLDNIVLEKIQQDQPQSLAEMPLETGLPEGEFEITISASQGQHQISIDGESVLTATDPEPLPPGGIGLWVEGGLVAEFDEVTLTAEEGPGEGGPPGEVGPPGEEGPPGEGGEVPPEVGGTPSTEDTSSGDTGGGLSGLLAEFTANQANPLELQAFVINLTLSAVFSFILSRVYISWGSSLSNRRRFAANFMLITITTTFIILVVRSSVALSLGLVGALSIVRFRTAVKEPEELAYLFFAIGLGIGLGDNQRLITILALAAGIILLGLMRLFRKSSADFNLHVTVGSQNPGKVELDAIMAALKPHCSQIKLMRFDDTEMALETSFLVEFRNMEALKSAKSALRALSESLSITFLDNKGIW